MNDRPEPQPIMDVVRPGATPASPSSRPVIASSSPTQMDPMMFTTQVSQPAPVTSVTPVVSDQMSAQDYTQPQTQAEVPAAMQLPTQSDPPFAANSPSSAPAPAMPVSATPSPSQAEPAHTLQHQEAFFGHIAHRKRSTKVVVFVLVLLVLATAVGTYFYLVQV